jgi:hypothetical protein
VPSPVIGANTVRRTADASRVEVGAGVAGVDLAQLENGVVGRVDGGVTDGRRFD